jgi:hypothetical protein
MASLTTDKEKFSSNLLTFTLESLSERTAITPGAMGFYKENSMMCFHHNGYISGEWERKERTAGGTTFVDVIK